MQTLLDNILFVPTVLVTVLAFGAVIRRLLGVRLGPVRSALAAVVALVVAGQLLVALLPPEREDTATGLWMLVLAVSCASVVAMGLVVVADVVVPEGSVPGPVELWRGWRGRIARTRRYAQTLRIAVRHGLGRFLRGRRHFGVASPTARRELARSLQRALDEGGVAFVKVGQQLSTRRDLIPPEFVEELSRLQDAAAPVPWERIREVLDAELGRPADGVFGWVDPEPLAAASIAQVHAARLLDGTDVVLKVQRPGIAAVVERDLDIVLRLARTLESRTAWGRALGVVGLAEGFADALREELDFTTERDNLTAMAAFLTAGPRRAVRVPLPFPDLSTGRVLVMERLAGRPLGSSGPALRRSDPEHRTGMAAALLAAVLDQVLDLGMFHVDLHPGNVLVAEDGTLGLLDFGSVGRVDDTTRRAFGRLLVALGSADSRSACDALLELVDRPDEVDERALERALGVLIVRYTAPGATVGAAALGGLLRLGTEHRLAIPAQVAALFRTFATLEGTLQAIDPGFDLVAAARSAGRERLAQSVTPQRLRRSVEEELAALLPVLRRIPRRLDRIGEDVEHGRLGLNVRLLADSRDRRFVTDLVHLSLTAVIGAVAGLMGVLFLGMRGGPQVTASVPLFAVLGYGLLVVAVVLVLRVLVVVLRQDSA